MNILRLKCRTGGIVGVLAVVFILFPRISLSQNNQNHKESESNSRAETIPGVVVVKLKDEPASKSGSGGLANLQSRHTGRIEPVFTFPEGTASKKSTDPIGLRRIYEFHYDSPVTPQALSRELALLPEIEYAEPKYVMRGHALPNDVLERKSQPAGVQPNDSLFTQMTHLRQVKLPEAWERVKGEQGGVVIAVVDTGIDWDHIDLVDNVWSNPGEIPNNHHDDDGNGYVDDVHGWNFTTRTPDPKQATQQLEYHGTATAGVAAAVVNNGIGIAGSSWNARFMPVSVSCEDGTGNFMCYGYEGIAYAAATGADIISCSWGSKTYSRFGQDVIRYAQRQGALVVASAGNDGSDNDRSPVYPASYRGVLSVGATDKASDVRADYSNYGASVGVFAPGSWVETTVPGDGNSYVIGTSFASPLVAGIAALVKTVHPDWNMDQVREQLRMTSDKVDGSNNSFPAGKMGRVNAYRAVTEEGHVSIRVVNASVKSRSLTENDGEIVEIEIVRRNLLAPAQGVVLGLATFHPGVKILDDPVDVGVLSTGDEITTLYRVKISPNLGISSVVYLRSMVQTVGGKDDDGEILRFIARPADVVTHKTGLLTFSLNSEGNLGWVNFAEQTPGLFGDISDDTSSPEEGFRIHDGPNQLLEGGILVATSRSRFSHNVRQPGSVRQAQGFRPVSGPMRMVTPGRIAAQESILKLEETNDPSTRVGLHITQHSFAEDDPKYANFVIVNYTLTNLTGETIHPLYLGMYLDWDIEPSLHNYVRYDRTHSMAMVGNTDQNPATIVASMLLTSDAGVNFRAIVHDETELFDAEQFSRQRKWNWLGGGIQRNTVDNRDVSTLLGAGPLSIVPGGSAQVAFALLGARSEEELRRAADAARDYWEQVIAPTLAIPGITGTADLPQRFALYQNFPNPFNPETTIQFDLPEPSDVRLTVYDLLGRLVATLQSGPMQAGHHGIRWDASHLPSGSYLLRLTADHFSGVKQMVLIR